MSDARVRHTSPGEVMVRTELFFGLGRAHGPDVSDDEWQVFLRDEVTPRFPDGFTVLDAHGQWRDAAGQIRHEPARVLVVLRPRSIRADSDVEEIRTSFKARFGQESVIRAESLQRVSF